MWLGLEMGAEEEALERLGAEEEALERWRAEEEALVHPSENGKMITT